MNILFLHGWQSTPGGVKPTYLRNHGHTVLNPQLPDDDFTADDAPDGEGSDGGVRGGRRQLLPWGRLTQ